MTQTQEFLLGLLKEFDEICRKYGIEYYLAGGSLIGALRNGGFLPWDDDADVHMTARNGERFMEALEKEGIRDRCVYVKSEDGSYMNVHWRYENTATTLLMRGQTGAAGPQGQFVDMFVMYPLPNDSEEIRQCLDEFEIYKELKSQNTNIITNRSIDFLNAFEKYKEREKKEGKKEVLKQLEEKLFYYPEEDAEYYFLCCPTPPKHQVPKSWWGEPRYVKFEDTELPVPACAEKFLAYEYGPNWFEVPSYEERHAHVFVKDFEIPYTVYTSEYNKHLDIEGFYRQEVEKKDYFYEIMKRRNIVNPHIRRLQGIRTSLEIQQRVKQMNQSLEEMIQKREETAIRAIFAPYYKLINSASMRYWGIYVDMPDEYLTAAFYLDCFNGNYGTARRVFRQRREQIDRPLLPELERLCRICDETDELLYCMYGERDDILAEQLAEKYAAEEPENLYFIRARMHYKVKNAQKGNVCELIDLCDAYLEKSGNDGELLKYKGDLLLISGERARAEECYKKGYFNLSNGYCLTEIRNYFEIEYGEFRI